jgi:hypothetical protein
VPPSPRHFCFVSDRTTTGVVDVVGAAVALGAGAVGATLAVGAKGWPPYPGGGAP